MYTLSSQTIYDNVTEQYRNIYVLDRKPSGDLEQIVRLMHVPKLSPFQDVHHNRCGSSRCIYAVYNPDQPSELLCIDEIATLFSWLMQQNYTIDTALSHMMNESKVKFKKRFVCFIKKN